MKPDEEFFIVSFRVTKWVARASGLLMGIGGTEIFLGNPREPFPAVMIAIGLSSVLTLYVCGWICARDEYREGLGIFWNMLTGKRPN